MQIRLLLLLVASILSAGAAPPSPAELAESKELFSRVDGSVTLDAKKIDYTATSGRI